MNTQISETILETYVPCILGDPSIANHVEELVRPITTPQTSDNGYSWSQGSYKFEKRTSDHGNAILYNLKKSRVEFDATIKIPASQDQAAVANRPLLLPMVNGIASLGFGPESQISGLISRCEASINNIPTSTNTQNKNFSLWLLNNALIQSKYTEEFNRIVGNCAFGGIDELYDDSYTANSLNEQIYQNAIRPITTGVLENGIIHNMLKQLPDGMLGLEINNGVVCHSVQNVAAREIKTSVSIPLNLLVNLFIGLEWISSYHINLLELELSLNPSTYLSSTNCIKISDCRLFLIVIYSIVQFLQKCLPRNATGDKFNLLANLSNITAPNSTGFTGVSVRHLTIWPVNILSQEFKVQSC